MEIILAICITALGIFGGMFFIWKEPTSSSSRTLRSSRTSWTIHRTERGRLLRGDEEPARG